MEDVPRDSPSFSSKKVIFAALAGNTFIALIKFIAALFTGSSAMLSEGIHSLVDTGNQFLMLYGLRQAQRPPDDEFPFGHGKEIYFWSFVVAILIFALGAGVSFYEGIHHLVHPRTMENVYVNYIVLGLAFFFESGSFYVAFEEFRRVKGEWSYLEAVRKGKDPTRFMVLFEDTAAMLGILVALTGVLLTHKTKNPFFDGVASIVIGLILSVVAVWLARETKGLLIGESANRYVVQGIRKIVGSFPGVERVNEVLTMHMGPNFILVNLSVDFADDLPAGEVEKTTTAIDRAIKKAFPHVRRVFIEAESQRKEPAS